MRWWLLFACIVPGLGYALLAYGWLPTLIGAATVAAIAVAGFIVRALTRANRHIDRILDEELGPKPEQSDDTGEAR